MKAVKVKVTTVSQESLDRAKELQIKKAKALYQSRPFVNQIWMAMQGFPIQFVRDNWAEITS